MSDATRDAEADARIRSCARALPTLPPAARSRVALGLDGGRGARPLRAAGLRGLRRGAVSAARGLPCVPVAPAELARRRTARASLSPRRRCITARSCSSASALPWRLGTGAPRRGRQLSLPSARARRRGAMPRARRGGARPRRPGRAGRDCRNREHADMADDPKLREMTCDPQFRKVLVTDGKIAGRAGDRARRWSRPAPNRLGRPCRAVEEDRRASTALATLPQVTLVPLDVTDGRSVQRARRRDRRQGRHPDQHRRTSPHLRHRARGAASRPRSAEMDMNYFGLLRLAQEFGPVDAGARAPTAPASAVAWVNLLSIYALSQLSAARHLLGLEGGGAFAVAVPARRDAAGRHPRHQRVPRPDRRRMEPAAAAAEAGALPRWRRRSSKALRKGGRGRLSRRHRAGLARALARQSEGARTRTCRGEHE